MKLSNAFTSKLLFIDKKVVGTMLLIAFCSIGLLAYKIRTNDECNEIIITLNSLTNHKNHHFFTGELVHFSAPMEGENEVVWDFGDKTGKITGGSVTHIYKTEGDYTVKVLVNGQCPGIQSLSIKTFVQPLSDTNANSSNVLIRDLSNPINAETFIVEQGKQLLFWSNIPAAAYEWSIVEDKTQLHKTADKASFNFQKTGNFTLKLILNNDPKTSWTRNITVNPRRDIPVANNVNPYQPPAYTPPPTPLPITERKEKKTEEPIVSPVIEKKAEPIKETKPAASNDIAPTNVEKAEKDIQQDDGDWKAMLQGLIKGDTRLDDFKPHIHDFDSKIVLANGESISFVELIGRLQKDKKLDEKSITIQQDYDTKQKRLKRLIVTYKKKKNILGL